MYSGRKWSIPTKAEEEELLAKAKSGDLQARNDLVTRNLPFVIRESRRWWMIRRVGWLEFDDFMQAAILGVIRAIHKWDKEKTEGRFISYAKYWIRHYIDAEIHYSKPYRVPIGTMHSVKIGRTKNPKTLDAIGRFSEMAYIDVNEDQSTIEYDDLVEHEEDLSFLHRQIESLTEEQRDILERKLQGQTLKEIGKELGCTGQTIANRINEITEMLRDAFRNSYPEESFSS